eukprot:5757898-Pyramimonas_sp.AAC.1
MFAVAHAWVPLLGVGGLGRFLFQPIFSSLGDGFAPINPPTPSPGPGPGREGARRWSAQDGP